MATLVLLPLLGITWIVGIFAVDENTAVFAWLFVILNSLQVLTENLLALKQKLELYTTPILHYRAFSFFSSMW